MSTLNVWRHHHISILEVFFCFMCSWYCTALTEKRAPVASCTSSLTLALEWRSRSCLLESLWITYNSNALCSLYLRLTIYVYTLWFYTHLLLIAGNVYWRQIFLWHTWDCNSIFNNIKQIISLPIEAYNSVVFTFTWRYNVDISNTQIAKAHFRR